MSAAFFFMFAFLVLWSAWRMWLRVQHPETYNRMKEAERDRLNTVAKGALFVAKHLPRK